MTTKSQTDVVDSTAEDRKYRWEVEPHPYDSSFDVFVTDDDQAASEAIKHAAETHLWDGIEAGEERTLKVRFNG